MFIGWVWKQRFLFVRPQDVQVLTRFFCFCCPRMCIGTLWWPEKGQLTCGVSCFWWIWRSSLVHSGDTRNLETRVVDIVLGAHPAALITKMGATDMLVLDYAIRNSRSQERVGGHLFMPSAGEPPDTLHTNSQSAYAPRRRRMKTGVECDQTNEKKSVKWFQESANALLMRPHFSEHVAWCSHRGDKNVTHGFFPTDAIRQMSHESGETVRPSNFPCPFCTRSVTCGGAHCLTNRALKGEDFWPQASAVYVQCDRFQLHCKKWFETVVLVHIVTFAGLGWSGDVVCGCSWVCLCCVVLS